MFHQKGHQSKVAKGFIKPEGLPQQPLIANFTIQIQREKQQHENEKLQLAKDTAEQKRVATMLFTGEQDVLVFQQDLLAASKCRPGW